MRFISVFLRRLAIACAAALTMLIVFPMAFAPSATTALAQRVLVSSEFREALEPYGEFRRHSRWGQVWVPAHVARDWRPYTVGRWVYTNDYGWYWNAADEEASWGWIVYHYGRWVWDDDFGWAWVPGREWGPGWVDWRRGSRHIGWAPLPPDEIIVEIRDEPRYWIFVEPRHFLEPRIATFVIRPEPVLLRETIVVNRTVFIRERNLAVNPGIAPAIIAAQVGRPIRAFDVQPRVLAGTANIRGAVQIRADQLRREDFRRQIARQTTLRQTNQTIRPASNVPAPTALAPNAQGRLGDTPPRAAVGTAMERELRTRERATTGGAPEPGARERGMERGPPGAGPERSARPKPGARERGMERGPPGAGPERSARPEPGARERGMERGPPGAGPERSARPEAGARERGMERGPAGAGPERSARPEPGARERGMERAGSERSARPEPGARERGMERAGPERSARPEAGARERGMERGPAGAGPERSARPEPGARGRGMERSTTGAGPGREER
jgi:hypothetical protein